MTRCHGRQFQQRDEELDFFSIKPIKNIGFRQKLSQDLFCDLHTTLLLSTQGYHFVMQITVDQHS